MPPSTLFGSAPAGRSTTTVIGPFAPGPKPCVMRSYARRLLCEVGSVPASSCPSRSENSGIASTTSTSTLAIAHGQGWSLTSRPQRANALFSWSGSRSAGPPAAFSARRSRPERTRGPATASSAGTRVSAESMVTATTTAEARPSAPTNATPETYRPRIATTTVLPATTIAAPDVATVRPIDCSSGMPWSSCSRCRATRNNP